MSWATVTNFHLVSSQTQQLVEVLPLYNFNNIGLALLSLFARKVTGGCKKKSTLYMLVKMLKIMDAPLMIFMYADTLVPLCVLCNEQSLFVY